MRPLVTTLVIFSMLSRFASGVAAAQEPIAPAVEQADDAEVPPRQAPPPPAPPQNPLPLRPVTSGPLLLPPGSGWAYHVVDEPPTHEKRWGLFSAGLVTLAVAWTASLQAGIPTGQVFLDVPLFGPLMEISQMGGGGDSSMNALVGWLDFLLVTDSALQIGGLAMLIAGAKTERHKPGRQRLELVPLGAGAAVRGTF